VEQRRLDERAGRRPRDRDGADDPGGVPAAARAQADGATARVRRAQRVAASAGATARPNRTARQQPGVRARRRPSSSAAARRLRRRLAPR
jgi:hypothetical protein